MDNSTSVTHPPSKHIVDELIEERAQKLMHRRLWPLYKAILYPTLRYRHAVGMADAIENLSARGVFDYLSALLHLDTTIEGLEHLPTQGRILIASTHPTGIPDGVAMFDALKHQRPDMTFFANRDALRAAPGLTDMIIPVEWVDEKRTPALSRETLVSAIKAFEAEKCVVLFPSGRLAFMGDDKQLVEQDWLPSAAIFARKYNCPIVPVHIEMQNSWLYYWFWKLNDELRDITLFYELLNKAGASYKITFGKPIEANQLQGAPAEVTKALRIHAMNGLSNGTTWKPLKTSPA